MTKTFSIFITPPALPIAELVQTIRVAPDEQPQTPLCPWCDEPIGGDWKRLGNDLFHVECYYEIGREMLRDQEDVAWPGDSEVH